MNKILVLGFILFGALNVFSAVKTWDGGGADANWQTAANWVGDIAPVAGDDLVFPAADRLGSSVQLTAAALAAAYFRSRPVAIAPPTR